MEEIRARAHMTSTEPLLQQTKGAQVKPLHGFRQSHCAGTAAPTSASIAHSGGSAAADKVTTTAAITKQQRQRDISTLTSLFLSARESMQQQQQQRKVKLLLVDHDDTAVESSREIHWPAHVAVMGELRPHQQACSFETWMEKNHSPGIRSFLFDEIGFTLQEREREVAVWRSFTARITPRFFPGFLHVLRDFAAAGGVVGVVSHSEEAIIRRHYRERGEGFEPAFVYAWNEHDRSKMKPAPFPVLDCLARCGLAKEDCAVLDDLSPGIEMARAAGVAALGAGWGHSVQSVARDMRAICDEYFTTVEDFRAYLLGPVDGTTESSS